MRGSLKRRGPSWAIILDLGDVPDPATGEFRRKQQRITVRGTKKQAEDRLADLIRDCSRGEFVIPSKLTFGAWLTQWVNGLDGSPLIRPTTLARYKAVVARVQT